jgi:AcrR family transcriptional regulator
LRSFYQFFDGKHELLLALFEDSVRATAEQLTERLAEQDDPLERLHSFVVEYYRFCRPGQRGKAAKAKLPPPVVVAFAQQLLTEYPQAAARAFTPIVSLFRDVLAEAVKAGAVRKDLRQEQVAGVVLQEVMFNAFSSTISGSSPRAEGDAAEELWDLIFYGIGAPA